MLMLGRNVYFEDDKYDPDICHTWSNEIINQISAATAPVAAASWESVTLKHICREWNIDSEEINQILSSNMTQVLSFSSVSRKKSETDDLMPSKQSYTCLHSCCFSSLFSLLCLQCLQSINDKISTCLQRYFFVLLLYKIYFQQSLSSLPVGIDVVVFNADNQNSVESVEDNVEDNVVDQGHEAGVPCLRCQAKLSRQWWKLNKYSHSEYIQPLTVIVKNSQKIHQPATFLVFNRWQQFLFTLLNYLKSLCIWNRLFLYWWKWFSLNLTEMVYITGISDISHRSNI